MFEESRYFLSIEKHDAKKKHDQKKLSFGRPRTVALILSLGKVEIGLTIQPM